MSDLNHTDEVRMHLKEIFGVDPVTVPDHGEMRYTVFTIYCHGGVLREDFARPAAAVRHYTRRLIAQGKGMDQQTLPEGEPVHITALMIVFRTEDGETRTATYSDVVECDHRQAVA